MIERPEEFEQAWAAIVAELTAGREGGSGPEEGPEARSEAVTEPEARTESFTEPEAGDSDPEARQARLQALFSPLNPVAEPPAATSEPTADPAAFVDNWEDEGHFVPPPPPELPAGTPVTRLGWAGLLGGPIVLAVLALTGWSAPRVVALGAGLMTLAGFLTLIWHLPDSRADSGWDDGARL